MTVAPLVRGNQEPKGKHTNQSQQLHTTTTTKKLQFAMLTQYVSFLTYVTETVINCSIELTGSSFRKETRGMSFRVSIHFLSHSASNSLTVLLTSGISSLDIFCLKTNTHTSLMHCHQDIQESVWKQTLLW